MMQQVRPPYYPPFPMPMNQPNLPPGAMYQMQHPNQGYMPMPMNQGYPYNVPNSAPMGQMGQYMRNNYPINQVYPGNYMPNIGQANFGPVNKEFKRG